MRVMIRTLVIGLLCLASSQGAAAADVPKCLTRDTLDSIEFVAAKAKLSQRASGAARLCRSALHRVRRCPPDARGHRLGGHEPSAPGRALREHEEILRKRHPGRRFQERAVQPGRLAQIPLLAGFPVPEGAYDLAAGRCGSRQGHGRGKEPPHPNPLGAGTQPVAGRELLLPEIRPGQGALPSPGRAAGAWSSSAT